MNLIIGFRRCFGASVLVVIILVSTARAASFQNLDFEQSTVPPNSDIFQQYPTSDLFPHWSVVYNGTPQTLGTINTYFLAGPSMALFTPGAATAYDSYLIEGNGSIFLGAWVFGDRATSITQTGDIPIGTQSLRFAARNPTYQWNPWLPGPFVISLNGVEVPAVILSSSGADATIGADITNWAGTTSDLRIGVIGVAAPGILAYASIDDITLSSQPIPEPLASALYLGCAGMLAMTRRRYTTSKTAERSQI